MPVERRPLPPAVLLLLLFGTAALIAGVFFLLLPVPGCKTPIVEALHATRFRDEPISNVDVLTKSTRQAVCWPATSDNLGVGAAAVLLGWWLLFFSWLVRRSELRPEDAAESGGRWSSRDYLGRRVRATAPVLAGLILGHALLLTLMASRAVRAATEWNYVRTLSMQPVLLTLVLPPLVVLFAALTLHLLERYELATVMSWLFAGVLCQLYLRKLSVLPLTTVMSLDTFNAVAERSDVGSLLREYLELAPRFPVHVKGNMPGKIVFYELLQTITNQNLVLSHFVILVSTCGALLSYLVAKRLFANSRAGLYALILYIFIPAKLAFLLTLNSVAPLFALGLTWLVLRFFDGRSPWILVGLGVVAYAAIFFEPSAAVLAPLFLAMLVYQWRTKRSIGIPSVLAMVLIPLAAFLATHLLVWWITRFDIFAALEYVREDASTFNRSFRPAYAAWLWPNFREFMVNTGFTIGLLGLALVAGTAGGLVHQWRRPRSLPLPTAFVVVVVANVVLVNLLGINRGEVSRLWIFLMVLLVVAVSGVLALQLPSTVFYVVLACTVGQAVLAQQMVSLQYLAFSGTGAVEWERTGTLGLDAYIVLFALGMAVWTVLRRKARPHDRSLA